MIVGIGCDVVSVNRCRAPLANRILSPSELERYASLQGCRQQEFLAGRFAIKEALIKALEKPLPMVDMDIQYEHQKPVIHLPGLIIHLSISHEKEIAIGFAVVERDMI